jgi:hypothetical protein
MRCRYDGAVVATTGTRRHSGASAGFGAVAEIASHGAGQREHDMDCSEPQSEAAGDDFLLDLGGGAEARLDMAEPPELTIVAEQWTNA